MKKAKIYLGVVMTALLGVSAVSCTDGNDWDVDSSHARLFGLDGSKLSIDAEDVQATLTFTSSPKAEYYIVEVSKDSLYDDIPLGESNTIVYGEDKSITESPAVLTGLYGDTKYYLRIKAMSSEINESKWAYYKTGSGRGYFKTKAEQIFIEPTEADRSEDAIRLNWIAGSEVTALSVYQSGEMLDSIMLDNAAIEAGTYTVENLSPSTTYKFFIWLEEAKRGELTVATTAAMPAADYKKVLAADETLISQAMLDEIAEQAAMDGKTNYGVTIAIPADAEVDFHGVSESGENTNIKIPNGMSITFFGLAGGEAPTIKFQKNLNIAGSHGYVIFENIKVVDNGAGYFINQGDECTVGEFTVKDCEISGFGTSFFRLQNSNAKTIEKLILVNSIFHDMCSGYSFIHVDAGSGAGVVKNIDIDQCTLYNIATGGKMFIYSNKTQMESLSVRNTTFYNCIGNSNYWVDFNGFGTTGKFEFVKCLFTKSADEVTNKNFRSTNNPVIDECYHTTDFFKALGSTALEYSSADLFANPEEGNFTLQKQVNVGDPRWIPAED